MSIPKPRICVFSGPRATIANSPPLVTSNKGRLPGEKQIPSKLDHLVPQVLYEPVTVKIRKFSAHPLERDAAQVYYDDGKDYLEVTLNPEDGPYPLPYVARRNKEGSSKGVPFEANDLLDAAIDYGGRQSFYPDSSQLFKEIDRTIYGRSEDGEGGMLGSKADFDFVRVLPSGSYTSKGEVSGVDFFPYKPYARAKNVRRGDLARVTNIVQNAVSTGNYEGVIWLEGSPHIEETLYWLNLLIDTDLPIVGNAAQRTHGELSNDGDRNIVDAVDYILSKKGRGVGAVSIQDQVIFASREVKKGDDRPGGYKATGGHGGILGTVKSGSVTVWYRPNFKHTSSSEVNMRKIPERVEFYDRLDDSKPTFIQVKKGDLHKNGNGEGELLSESIPRVHIVKYSHYSQEDENENPDDEVDILARISRALEDQSDHDGGLIGVESKRSNKPKMHGFVLEGSSPYAKGTIPQMKALQIATFSGMPVVRVGRSDPGGRVVTDENDFTIEGSNLDANKARILLIASLLKLGRLPKAKDARNPTSKEKDEARERLREFQNIFESH